MNRKKNYTLQFLGRCSDIDQDTWNQLMRSAQHRKPLPLHRMIKRDCPELTQELFLDYPVDFNPYSKETFTKKVKAQRDEIPKLGIEIGDIIDVYTHSATEYFFKRIYDE